ncbi:unnamed protein product [Clavelina lepadiformis]|uniref:Cilia- and flagella-associated protein 99 n=1 Tax=Clavelina lepadiformis TaxID=159417 RepID=A0ABP0FPN0_CLALP
MLQYKDLLEICIQAMNCFSSENQSVEEHIKAYLKKQKGLDDGDHTFIVEIFSGCIQYTKLLNVVVGGFYATKGKNCLRVDTNLYKILCYMIMFRLDELGISNLNKFINTQDVNKMYRFLNFFMDDQNLTTWIRDEWCKQYDSLFVEEEIMKHLLRWKEDLDLTVFGLEDVINNKILIKPSPKTSTKPHSFNLTKPKPRSIPIPEKIPTVKKHQPVPKHIFEKPREMEVIQKAKETNQRKAEQKLFQANEDQFVCAHPEKSLKTKAIMQEIIDDECKKLNFNQKHMRQVPPHIKENRPIKMNAAAILREGSLFQKKEKQELQKLDNLLSGAKDTSDFLEWQSTMRQKDQDEKMAESEQRRVMGKLSHEEAILARQNQVQANKEMVSQLKFETAKMMQEYLTMRLDEEKQMRQLVEQITEGHQNTQEAQIKLKEYKRKIVQEVNAESREMMKRALEEAEEDMRRKSQLIQQIRAMESIPIIRQKLVDFTSTAGHELLSEMSIAELHERLSLLRETQLREEEERRDTILKEKQAKNEALMETLARITTHRNELSKAATSRTEEQERLRQVKEKKLKEDKKLQALQEELDRKKEERLRRSKEMSIKPNKQSAIRTKGLIRQKKELETTRWRQLEMGQQRMAETRARTAKSGGRYDSQRTNATVKTALKIS